MCNNLTGDHFVCSQLSTTAVDPARALSVNWCTLGMNAGTRELTGMKGRYSKVITERSSTGTLMGTIVTMSVWTFSHC